MIKVFTLNKNGKIELTEKELKQLLDDVYWEGYRDNNKSWTYTTPIVRTTPLTYPYWSNTTSDSITLGSTITTDSTITGNVK